MSSEAEELYNKGQEAFKSGKTLEALAFGEKAFNREPENAEYQSFLGVCIAYERGAIKEGINLCERALQAAPKKVKNYLNLGRVYLRAGLKQKAIEVFRRGLKVDNKNPEIIAELQALGLRKKNVFPSLPREHFLNKYLGIVLSRIGLR